MIDYGNFGIYSVRSFQNLNTFGNRFENTNFHIKIYAQNKTDIIKIINENIILCKMHVS